MNPARLAELRHQQSLLREHLAWLDREIAKEVGGVAPVALEPTQTVHAAPAVTSIAVTEFDSYVPDPVSTAAETRRGCFVALALGVLLILAGLTAIYLLKYRDRPLIFPTAEAPAATAPAKSK